MRRAPGAVLLDAGRHECCRAGYWRAGMAIGIGVMRGIRAAPWCIARGRKSVVQRVLSVVR